MPLERSYTNKRQLNYRIVFQEVRGCLGSALAGVHTPGPSPCIAALQLGEIVFPGLDDRPDQVH